MSAENSNNDEENKNAIADATNESSDKNNLESNESAVPPADESVDKNPEQGESAAQDAKTDAPTKADTKKDDELDKLVDNHEGSDTAIESDIDSDFDNIEDVDDSYKFDSTLWKQVDDLSLVDLKPAPKEGEGENKDEKKKKKEEDVEEEDSGYADFYHIRTQKECDQEFQEYIRELCRPQIISYLNNRCVAKGSDIRLTCTVKGNNVQARWLKDGAMLERSKNIQTRSDGEIYILEITEITEKLAGVYTCEFKNRAGEVETSSTIRLYDGKLHKPDHLDIALVKDYYDYALGGLVIEANVHGLPRPKVKFFKDGHLLYERVNKISFFVEDGSIYQCLLVRPDASASGVYTVLAENGTFKKRFDHRVDFVTKYSTIHYPLIRHADKKLDDFVDEMLQKVPKHPEEAPKPAEVAAPIDAQKLADDETKELLQAVSTELASVTINAEGGAEEKPKEKKKHHHHTHHKHRKDNKKKEAPKIDADLVDDGEQPDQPSEQIDWYNYKRKFSSVVHEPYESEPFRIFNSKERLWFSGGLRNQTVFEGSKTKLLCTVSGPQPMMKWLKNGRPLSWSNVIRNLTAEGIGCVIFDKLEKSDAGVYTCSARNQSCEVTTESIITIIPKLDIPRTPDSKPFFSAVLNESYHIVENDLILDVFVRGVPDPKVKWYKDGEEIKQSHRIAICSLHDDGKYQLRIHHPDEAKDNGMYECEAVNSSGKARVKHIVNFKNHLKHTHPQYVYHKEDFSVPPMPKIVLEPKPEPKMIVDVPAPKEIVKKEEESHVAGDEESTATGENEGEGNEDAVADENASSTENADEGEAKVEKKERKPKSSRRRRYEGPVEPLLIRDSKLCLSMAVNLRDITSPVGKNIKLCCQVAGPSANVKWLKNGKPIEQSPKLRMPKKDGFGIITIEKAQESDSGIYRCFASNSFNVVQTECKVTVFPIEEITVKPTFSRIKDYYNVEFDDLIIEVQVRGTPMPILAWKRDGVDLDITDSGKFMVMREPHGVYKLCIHQPQKVDGGRFVVEASNSVGKEEIRCSIRFPGRESFLHTPGIYHADPKKEKEEDPSLANIVIQPEVEPEPESDEPMMDKWGNMIAKKEKKVRLRQKIFLPKTEEDTKEERHVIQQVRNHVEFESELKNCVAIVGQKAKLLCTAIGPGAKLKWLKDDEEMEFEPPKIKNTTAGLFGSVTFLAIAEKDAGVYKCVASNGICEASTECTITVIPYQDPNWIKPTYTRNIKEYYDGKTNDLILEVHVRGYPKPKLSWNKDGLDIEDGDDKYFSTRHPDGVHRLNIHDPMIRDSGRYGCSAMNEAGVEVLKYYLKVKSREEYYHTALLHHADKSQFAKHKETEKKRMHLLFRRSNLNYDEEQDTYADVDLDDEIIPETSDEIPVQEEAAPEAGLTEAAAAENEEEEDENGEKKVKEKPKSRYHLEFLTNLENQTGVENTTVKLFCQIAGLNPQVSWLQNGTPVKYTEDIKNMSNESVAAILLLNAKPEYSGEYTCIIKNRECKIEQSACLNILTVPKPKPEGIKPHYPFGMKHSFNSQTDELIIEVVIRGTPRLFIKWYKDAREIQNDDKYLLARDGETYKIYVSKPTFRDAGIYLLQTENDYGMEFLKYVIEFEEKETPVVSGFIYHADISMLKKAQEKKRRAKMLAQNQPETEQAPAVETASKAPEPKPVEKAKPAETTKPTEPEGDEAAGTSAENSSEIQKPIKVFRAHKILDFRKNADIPLEIIKRLVSSVVCAGTKLKLSCCVSEGDARIKAQWFRNGEPLVIDARYNSNATEDGIVSLEIKETMIEDSGRYKVIVKTKKGDISNECDVTVYEREAKYAGEDVAPVILKAIEDYYRPALKDYVIEICFRGTPKPTLEWTFTKDGLPINPWKQYTKYQIKHEELNGHYKEQLIISNFKFIDNGRYLIRMENRAGILDIVHVLDFELPQPEEKRKRMDDIFIMNEVPRVLPKAKSPTPPPVVEPPPEETKEEEVVEEEEVEEEEEAEDDEE